MSNVIASRHWLTNTDGTLDGRWPAGDKPPSGGALSWDVTGYLSLLGTPINNAVHENVRSFLNGGNAGLATITIVQVSGDNAATENWTIASSDYLDHPVNSDAGAGVFKLRATYGAETADSPNRSWSYIVPPPPSGAAIKWHPGIYLLSTSVAKPANPYNKGYTDSFITGMPTACKGWLQPYWWSAVEGLNADGTKGTAALRGNYTVGIQKIMDLRNLCASVGKRLWIRIIGAVWVGTASSQLPTYIATEPGGAGGFIVANPSGTGTSVKEWNAAINNRKIALTQALAAVFNDDPYFEGITFGEMDVRGTTGSDYNHTTNLSEMQRFFTASIAVWTKTNVTCWMDFAGVPQDEQTLIDFCFANRIAISQPDTYPQAPYNTTFGYTRSRTWADRVCRGERWNGTAWVAGAGTDYRGKLCLTSEVANDEMGGRIGVWTAAEFATYARDDMQLNYLFMERKDWTSSETPPDLLWDAGSYRIKPYLDGTPATMITAKPTSYPAINTS